MATISNYAQQISMLNRLNGTYASMNKHMTAITTGQKVNSAADDAAAYAIGKRMGVKIGSLDQAAANTQTGASMLKVADGAVSSTLDILTTLREKALEAANSTANDKDRAALQTVMNQYIDQINDNALVSYNGMSLMDGSKSGVAQTTNQAFTNKMLSTDTTGATKLTDLTSRTGGELGIAATDTITVSYVKDGKTYTNSYQAGETTLEDIFQKANEAGGGEVFDTNLGSDTLIGTDIHGKELHTVDDKNAITVKAATAGTKGAIAGFNISVTGADGNAKKSVNAALSEFTETIPASNTNGDNSLKLQVGDEANNTLKISLGRLDAQALGLQGSDGKFLSIATAEDANAALSVIDNAISKALEQSVNIGATSSRLEYTYNNLTTQSENLTAAQSTLLDADMVKEILGMTSDNVIAQATQSMLAQSYNNSNWFLNLLG